MANNELNLRELRGEHDAEFESALCKAFEEVAALAAVPLDKRTTVILYKIWQAARAAAPAHAEPSGALPELPFGTDNLARLMRNLEGTSYNEGSEALACRLSDCRTVIAELLADRASRGQQGKQAIEARGGALPAGLVYAIERAINKARTPGGQHTNGPTFASLEVSQLEFVLKHCILGQQGGGDAARINWMIANPSWSIRWRIHTKKQIEQWQMVDNGESWGQWGNYRNVLDAAIQAQAGDAPTGGDRD